MAYVIAEAPIGAAAAATSTAAFLKCAPDKAKSPDERCFAISLIKYPSEPVLDVGTGNCACVASILARRRMRAVALDKDRRTIRAARRFLAREHLNKAVQLVRDDITASGQPSSSFRNIVCFNALHHVSPLGGALDELRRILAVDGRLIISDFDEKRNGFLERLEQAVGRLFPSVAAYSRPSGRVVLICEK